MTMAGLKHSAETKARMSAAHRGREKNARTRARMSAAQKGHVVSDETKQKLAEAARGRTHSAETRAKMSKSHKGKIKTPEHLANISKAKRERGSQVIPRGWGNAGIHAGVWMRCLNSEGGFARDCDAAEVLWEYEPRTFHLSWCDYTPDFYLPEFGIWIEVKGHPQQTGQWREKIATFRQETGKTLVVVFQSELSARRYGGN